MIKMKWNLVSKPSVEWFYREKKSWPRCSCPKYWWAVLLIIAKDSKEETRKKKDGAGLCCRGCSGLIILKSGQVIINMCAQTQAKGASLLLHVLTGSQ